MRERKRDKKADRALIKHSNFWSKDNNDRKKLIPTELMGSNFGFIAFFEIFI